MNLHCLQCGKPVPQTPGKRAKSYCNNTCRVTYWKKQKEVASGVEKRKPGRPAKALIIINPEEIQNKIAEAKKKFKNKPKLKGNTKDIKFDSFMGHAIPNGLKGIELAIWKAEIKEKR